MQHAACNTQHATRSMCTAELKSADGVRPVRSLATVRRTAASSSEFELSGFGQLALKGRLFCLKATVACVRGLLYAWGCLKLGVAFF